MVVTIIDELREYIEKIVDERSSSKATAPFYASWAVADFLRRRDLILVSGEDMQCAACPRRDFQN